MCEVSGFTTEILTAMDAKNTKSFLPGPLRRIWTRLSEQENAPLWRQEHSSAVVKWSRCDRSDAQRSVWASVSFVSLMSGEHLTCPLSRADRVAAQLYPPGRGFEPMAVVEMVALRPFRRPAKRMGVGSVREPDVWRTPHVPAVAGR